MPTPVEQFVSEPITPVKDALDVSRMAVGEPGLPRAFAWRGTRYRVAHLRSAWKESGPCRTAGREVYLRKHWYEVETTDGSVMKLYFERQSRGNTKRRWWLYTLAQSDHAPSD